MALLGGAGTYPGTVTGLGGWGNGAWGNGAWGWWWIIIILILFILFVPFFWGRGYGFGYPAGGPVW